MHRDPFDSLQVMRSDRDAILAFVRDRDVDCPLCGYNLRNLSEPRCPECGNELQLQVGLAHLFISAWVATFAACAPAAGLGVLCLVITLREGPPGLSGTGAIFAAHWWCLAMLPVTVLLVWRRTRFMRLSRVTQVGIAVVSVMTAVAMLIWVLTELLTGVL